MQYILKHKNIDVAEIDLNEHICQILGITKVFSFEHMPLGTCPNSTPDYKLLNSWWTGRSIPASRQGIENVLNILDIDAPYQLLNKSLGLSLSDQYWIAPKNKHITWEDVNFFSNDFSNDIGNLLFGKTNTSAQANLMSPDNTSDGWLKKKWKIINKKRCLVKGGSLPFMQQPFNEVIAHRLCQKLDISHVHYSITWENELPYSVCENFIDVNTELIPASRVILSKPKMNHVSKYNHYVNCCKENGLRNITLALDKMIVLDYIIANQDRHWNNFGVIRNSDTLKWLMVAPIYDSGSSLGYNMAASKISSMQSIECKPFKKTHEEQIGLVKSFDWLDLKPAYDVIDEYNDLLKTSEYIDDTRRSTLCKSLENRLNMLQSILDNPKKINKPYSVSLWQNEAHPTIKYEHER